MGQGGGGDGENGGKWGEMFWPTSIPLSPHSWTLGHLELGKSLPCYPRLVVTLGGSGKRNFDTPNILMLQKISHCLHKVTGEIKHQATTSKQGITHSPIFPPPPLFPCH